MTGLRRTLWAHLEIVGRRSALAVCGGLVLVAACSESPSHAVGPVVAPERQGASALASLRGERIAPVIRWWTGAGAAWDPEGPGRARAGHDRVHPGVGLGVSDRDEYGQVYRSGRATANGELCLVGDGRPDLGDQ